ncbi:arabinan endo-1,5-alpha-L-arabinosidase [Paenibacillus phyllosphaerae]|uniref:Arabinan endo-1,5-alpha-L-arabinosidase n=1 Tax=Paenibacillus phyllosphaerae TaxID=274593 RepID=A0A7W5FL34_9BACL|nr:arabinan endo-1,5-alpha-L-arabinosidase [Paenibacillus phyllosphaerae]MBB3108761.1 arabinan endo-1,5-alpha-L-arabinosidase [Paenibacillus phyllosphaerae]
MEALNYKRLLADTSLDLEERNWGIYNTHDPSIFKDGDLYYVFSTDTVAGDMQGFTFRGGIQVRRSSDLIHWDWVGYAMDGVPADAKSWTGAVGMWAPEVCKIGDLYYLYYCASQFGKNQSFIGVAVSSSIEGPWTDLGEVVKTSPADAPNAIDPNLVDDREGRLWLVYGSFFGGIYAAELNRATGKLLLPGFGTLIARRDKTREGAVEGPYVIYHPEHDYYYLFVSYDSLFSNYNVRVGRSKQITGPYVDYNGHELTDIDRLPPHEIGTKLMGGYRFRGEAGVLAPGHNSILREGSRYYIVHHERSEQSPKHFAMQVREIHWTLEGWPVVSPERYSGVYRRSVRSSELPGAWEFLVHLRQSDGLAASEMIRLLPGGSLANGHGRYEWRDTELTVRWNKVYELSGEPIIVKGAVFRGYDWSQRCETLLFSGLDQRGTAVWGKRK